MGAHTHSHVFGRGGAALRKSTGPHKSSLAPGVSCHNLPIFTPFHFFIIISDTWFQRRTFPISKKLGDTIWQNVEELVWAFCAIHYSVPPRDRQGVGKNWRTQVHRGKCWLPSCWTMAWWEIFQELSLALIIHTGGITLGDSRSCLENHFGWFDSAYKKIEVWLVQDTF